MQEESFFGFSYDFHISKRINYKKAKVNLKKEKNSHKKENIYKVIVTVGMKSN